MYTNEIKTEFDKYESIIDERHTEYYYNGCFDPTDDPMDYIDLSKVGAVNA